MTKIRIKDTPQAYKDIVKYGLDSSDFSKLNEIGNVYSEFEERDDNYVVKCGGCWYNFPKSACEIIEDEQPNYLEQANEIRRQIGNYHMSNEPNTDLLRMIVKRQDLILKHLESKEVEHERD